VHDELQFECPPDYADTLSSALTISALTAGEHYNLRISIAAEAKVGKTWADVH
jgi:DNA polymerase I-like protein with 3'-5' exonuclease and polymerase domains